MPAAIRIMADAVTGDGSVGSGDTKKLLQMMQKGQLDPNKALPLFAKALDIRAAGGKEKYLKTQRAQQDFSRVALEDQIKLFGKAGGNEGFFRIWKTFAETLKKMSGLTRALAGGFKILASAVEMFGTIIQSISWAFDKFYELPTSIQNIIEAFTLMGAAIVLKSGIIGRALGKVGRALGKAFWPITTAFLAIEDIYLGLTGVDSLTKRVMDYFNPKTEEGSVPEGGGTWKRPPVNIPTSEENAVPFMRRSLSGMSEAGFGFQAKMAYLMQGFVPTEHNPTAYLNTSNLDRTYNLNINVSGATTFDKSLADEIARQSRQALQPLMLAKEVGE